jgi:hypothetical protein
MSAHTGHFICKCRHCDVVITQCRCPDPSKNVVYSICDKCVAKQMRKEEKENK